jgi:3-methylcrotonyl-CoA carboxylase alpha subunit
MPLALVDTLYVGGAGNEVEGGLRAPMPGKVFTLLADPGAIVEMGMPLLVLEAMKMKHTITAPRI